MKKRMRRNSHWSTEDKALALVGVAAAVGIFAIVKQKRSAPVATSGFRGIGAYFIDPVNVPFSGLGSNYVAVR